MPIQSGRKDVTVTVTFDQPYYAQVRLQITCMIRSDIVMNPGDVNLGVVKRGKSATKTMQIEYAGDPKWEIAGATCLNPAMDVKLEETHRGGGTCGYSLTVTLKSDAPPGVIRDKIVLGVKDGYNNSLDVALQGSVQADLTLSPAQLSFGNVPAGGGSVKQALLKGARPFRVLSIDGDDGPFQIERPKDAKPLHVLKVTLKAGEDSGDVTQAFKIVTDMDGEGPVTLTAVASVVKAARPRPKPEGTPERAN